MVRTTNAPMYLEHSVYEMTNGVFEGGVVNVGNCGGNTFNQYGGTSTIQDLQFFGVGARLGPAAQR